MRAVRYLWVLIFCLGIRWIIAGDPTSGPPVAIQVATPAGEPAAGVDAWLVPVAGTWEAMNTILHGVTDATGRVELVARAPRYDLVAGDSEGHRVLHRDLDTRRPREVQVRLQPGAVVTGTVVDRTRDRPVTRGAVELYYPDLEMRWARVPSSIRVRVMHLYRRVISLDTEGRFRADGLLPGRVLFRSRAPDYVIRPRDIRLAPGARRQISLDAIVGGASLEVRVVDVQGNPLAGVTVRTRFSSRFFNYSEEKRPIAEITDRDGWVRFYGLLGVQELRLMVDAFPYGSLISDPIHVRPGERQRRTLTVSPGNTITGVAIDEDGNPVRHIPVPTVFIMETMTPFYPGPGWTPPDEHGRFRIRGLPEGTVNLALQPPGFQPQVIKHTFTGHGQSFDVGRQVFSRGASIKGRVVNDLNVPIGFARIRATSSELYTWSPGANLESESRPDGRFRVDGLREGARYHLLVSAKGHLSTSVRDIQAGTKNVVVRLDRLGGLRGRLVDAEGKPHAEFKVYARLTKEDRFGRAYQTLVYNPEGRFDLDDVPPGSGLVRFVVPGYGEKELTVNIGVGETLDLGEVVVDRGCPVRLWIENSIGQPVVLASLRLERTGRRIWGSQEAYRNGLSDENGRVDLGYVNPGLFKVRVRHPDYPEVLHKIEVDDACQVDPQRILLPRGGRLRVCVVDARDQPVPKARVSYILDRPMQEPVGGQGETDETGCVTSELLIPGRYHVRASVMDWLVRGRTQNANTSAEVKPDETREVTLKLCELEVVGRLLRGGVVISQGQVALIPFVKGRGSPGFQVVVLRGQPEFRFCIKRATQYWFDYSGPDGTEVSTMVNLPEPDPTTGQVRLDLELPNTQLEFYVTDATTGQPVERARISYVPKGEKVEGTGVFDASCQTRSDGRCTLWGFSPLPGEIDVRHNAYRGWHRKVEKPKALPPFMEIALERGAVLTGRVTDKAGNPVEARAYVRGLGQQGYYMYFIGSAPIGTYRVQGLPLNQPFTLLVTAPDLAPRYEEGLVMTESEHQLDIQLDEGAVLEVRVVDETGAPVADAVIQIRTPRGHDFAFLCGPENWNGKTDARGVLRFRHAPLQPIVVEAGKEKRKARTSLTPMPFQTNVVTLVLNKAR